MAPGEELRTAWTDMARAWFELAHFYEKLAVTVLAERVSQEFTIVDQHEAPEGDWQSPAGLAAAILSGCTPVRTARREVVTHAQELDACASIR
jgi:8-oxo-dGTP pyrophosphatase MutT (NUDIX family)